jgi:hypothetical protein
VREGRRRDGGTAGLEIGTASGHGGAGRREAIVGGGVDVQDGVEGVVVVVFLDVGAVVTSYVEERTMQQFELFTRVVGALGESCESC